MVLGSTLGMSHLSNSIPISRSIQGNAFSWPTATSTVVAGDVLIRLASRNQIAPALGVEFGFHLLENHTGQAAVLVGELFRHQEIEDRDILVHGVLLFPGGRLHLLEARAHHHLHILAAEAADERQQSMAVLPPPSTITRLPILLMWPKETEDSQSIPMWIVGRCLLAARNFEITPRGAPEPTKIASQPSASSA